MDGTMVFQRQLRPWFLVGLLGFAAIFIILGAAFFWLPQGMAAPAQGGSEGLMRHGWPGKGKQRPGPSARPSDVPSPSAAPSATPAPSAAPSAAPGTVPGGLQPNGPLPAGWHRYVSANLGFAIAYPADWTVDESGVTQGRVSFSAPGGQGTLQIVTEPNTTGASGDLLRERFYAERVQGCGIKAIQRDYYATLAGLNFASREVYCEPSLVVYGAAYDSGAAWYYQTTAPWATRVAMRDTCFAPMLQSLKLASAR